MIVIVKVSARRWIAVQCANAETGWRSTASPERNQAREPLGYTYAEGEIVAGPADWTTVDRGVYELRKKRNQALTYAEYKRQAARDRVG